MSTENTFVDEPDRVIIYDDLAGSVIHNVLGFNAYEAAESAFQDRFEIVEPRGHWLADPAEDFYQGVSVMSVIRRKRDGRLFGFQYWTPVSKHGEPFIEPNGEQNGLEFEVPDGFDWDADYFPSPHVWLPVEPFTITGYKITKDEN